MKGLAASVLESLSAAEAAGHAGWLRGEIASVVGEPLVERLVEGWLRHAARRIEEMEAARELLLELGVEPRVAAASASVLAELTGRQTGVRVWAVDDAAGRGSVMARARALVGGAYDLHVHVAPDVPVRRIDDLALAHGASRSSGAGFALKSHHVDRRARAGRLRRARRGGRGRPDADPQLGRWRNGALAVEIAAREGARIVWMPTVDSPAETAAGASRGRTRSRSGHTSARAAQPRAERRAGASPVDGELLPAARDVVQAIARHGLVLATGHLARDDTFAVVDAALEEGVADIVVTHPEFPCQDFSNRGPAGARRAWLPDRALPDHSLSGKTTWEHVLEGVRAVGVDHSLFSSDCGNPDYPPVEDGLALWGDRLLGAGFDEDEARELIVTQSRRLAGAE